MTNSKVTLSCRILPEQKLELAETAKSLGLSLSQYVEALVLKNHKTIEEVPKMEFTWEEVDSLLPDNLREVYRDFMDKLKIRFPDASEQQIVTATLAHGFENHGAWVQHKLKRFLNRLETNFYTLKKSRT